MGSLDVHYIRDEAEHPALWLRIRAHLGAYDLRVAWDISTGDPIVPAPHEVALPRLLDDQMRLVAEVTDPVFVHGPG